MVSFGRGGIVKTNMIPFRVGMGYDVHRFVDGRPLIIGGVKIPYFKGLYGHSDADVLTHAIIDAVIGAMSKGDIGIWFPDTDPQYKGVNSLELLRKVVAEMHATGYLLCNVDAVIVAEYPKLAPHLPKMIIKYAKIFGCMLEQVNLKATTSEKLGFTGRQEGISASAVVSLISRKFANLE